MTKPTLDITVEQATAETVEAEVRKILEGTDWAKVCAKNRGEAQNVLGFKDIANN